VGTVQALKTDLETGKAIVESCTRENAALERELETVRKELERLNQERDQVLETYRSTKIEYEKWQLSLTRMAGTSGSTVFNDAPVITILTEMTTSAVSPEELRRMWAEIVTANEEIQKIESAIASLENAQNEDRQRIEAKIAQMDRISDELGVISERLHRPVPQDDRPKLEYTEGAPDISMEDLGPLPENMNHLVILFRDFQMVPSFIGKRSSELFLAVDLFEQPESTRTQPVDPKSGWFNSRLEMPCKNDFILVMYFGKSAVPVQLCRSRDDQITEIGKTELLLTPFVENHITAFASSVHVWNASGKVVAKINFQVALAKPLPV
jgi:hypothetical protein